MSVFCPCFQKKKIDLLKYTPASKKEKLIYTHASKRNIDLLKYTPAYKKDWSTIPTIKLSQCSLVSVGHYVWWGYQQYNNTTVTTHIDFVLFARI